MKIKVDITKYALAHINEVIANNLPNLMNKYGKAEKAQYFLLCEVADKLLKKAIDRRNKPDQFKLELKYYEAYALHKFLLDFIDYNETESRRISRHVLGEINQKLT